MVKVYMPYNQHFKEVSASRTGLYSEQSFWMPGFYGDVETISNCQIVWKLIQITKHTFNYFGRFFLEIFAPKPVLEVLRRSYRASLLILGSTSFDSTSDNKIL